MPCSESTSATGLQVAFEGLGLCKRFECEVGFHLPRHEFGRVGDLTGLVPGEASAEIGCAADVALGGVGETA